MDNHKFFFSPVSLVTVSTLTLHWVKNEAPRASDCVWVPVDTEVELVADLDENYIDFQILEKERKLYRFIWMCKITMLTRTTLKQIVYDCIDTD